MRSLYGTQARSRSSHVERLARQGLVLSIGLIVFSICAGTSHAQGLTEQFAYDANLGTLPSDQGWTHVTLDPLPDDGLDISNYSIIGVGGFMRMVQGPTGGISGDDANKQFMSFDTVAYDFDNDVVVVDFNLKILASTLTAPGNPSPRGGFGVLLSTSSQSFTLYIGEDGLFFSGGGGATSSLAAYDTMVSLADYRIRIDEIGATVSINGTDLLSFPRSSFAGVGAANTLRFGDLTGLEQSSSELFSISLSRGNPIVTEVRELEFVQASSPLTSPSIHSLLVDCPPGKQVITGGAQVVGPEGEILLTTGHPGGGVGNGSYTQWFARAEERIPTAAAWQLHVTLVCGEIPGAEWGTAGSFVFGPTSAMVSSTCPIDKVPLSGGVSVSPDDDEKLGLTQISSATPLATNMTAGVTYFSGGIMGGIGYGVTAWAGCSSALDWIVRAATTTSNSTTPKDISVACPTGMVTVGGGARIIDGTGSVALHGSYPEPFLGADPVVWSARAEETTPTSLPWSLEVTAICGPHAESTVTRRELRGRWRADSGLPTDDLGQNPGVLTNGATIEPGLDDLAFSFDALNMEWLKVPGDDFYPACSFTVDAWIQTGSLIPDETTMIVSLYDIGGVEGANWSSYWMYLQPDGTPGGFMRPAAANVPEVITGTQSLADGEPHHMALVRSSENPSSLSFYIDGELIGSSPLTGTQVTALSPPNQTEVSPLVIGGQSVSGNFDIQRPMDGLIDDVKFYDRALSAQDIQDIAGCGLPILPRVLNLDAARFGASASTDNDHRYCVFLEAGSYTLDLVTPALNPAATLTAWAPSSTDPWVTTYSVVGEIDGGVSGGSGTGDTSAQAAFDNTSIKQEVLVLTADQRVYFSVVDAPPVLDNEGGVSIAIAVPEPGFVWTLLSGSGLLVLLQRVRRRRAQRRSRFTAA